MAPLLLVDEPAPHVRRLTLNRPEQLNAMTAELCEELGVERSDVTAFGDQLNDLPMLAWAGYGVAVANAHPDVIDVADEVTASNDEDGVALALERLSA